MAFHWATMMAITSTPPHGNVNDVVEYKKLSKNILSMLERFIKS
jgi:hypothetical protein